MASDMIVLLFDGEGVVVGEQLTRLSPEGPRLSRSRFALYSVGVACRAAGERPVADECRQMADEDPSLVLNPGVGYKGAVGISVCAEAKSPRMSVVS